MVKTRQCAGIYFAARGPIFSKKPSPVRRPAGRLCKINQINGAPGHTGVRTQIMHDLIFWRIRGPVFLKTLFTFQGANKFIQVCNLRERACALEKETELRRQDKESENNSQTRHNTQLLARGKSTRFPRRWPLSKDTARVF